MNAIMTAIPKGIPSRLKKHLPILSLIVSNPMVSSFWLIVAAGFATILSIHYALSLLILTLPVIFLYLERNMLGRILIPPFSIVVMRFALGSGVGIALITYANGNVYDPYLMRVQIVTLLAFPFGWFFYRLGFGSISRMILPEENRDFADNVIRPLIWVGWFFLVWQLVKTFVLAYTGNLDRGDLGAVATDQDLFGFWTYWQLFPRLDGFGFFLIPLIFQRSGALAKVVAISLLTVYFAIAFASGSRGIVFYPLLYIGVGSYFFQSLRSVKLDIIGLLVFLIILPLVVFIHAYRNTEAYRATRTLDIIGRLSAIDDAIEKLRYQDKETQKDNSSVLVLGLALLEVSDSTIYEITPSGIPFAGFDNFGAILYTWVPSFISRDKPILLDGNIFMWDYVNKIDRSGREVSLFGDAYRRFGWIGIPVFVAFFFWLYGLICGRFYGIYLRKNALLGVLLILLLFSYFQNNPFGTVLTTWWGFFYEIPKHLVPLFFGYWILKSVLGIKIRGGAIRYWGRD